MTKLSPRYWMLVAVLTLVYAYAFVDRVVLALMVDPIKQDLGLSDVQIGLLLGAAFALFYGVLNLPAGYLVDRVSRRGLIAAAAVVWSLMTVACGAAGNFVQLFLGRAGVGIAEATITPASYSLILDTVPPLKRGLTFSVYAMAPIIGGAIAYAGGGVLYGVAQHGAFHKLPIIGGLHPWQIMLVIIGLAGLPVSMLLALFREPARQKPNAETETGFADTFRHMQNNAARYIPLVAYVTFGAMITFSEGAWLPAIFGRTWHLPVRSVGIMLGPTLLASGVIGLVAGGIILNRLLAAGYDIRLYGMVCAIGALVGFAIVPWAPNPHIGLIFAGFGIFFAGTNNPIAAITLAEITPAHLMGKVTAIYLLMQTLIGQAFAPVIVALVAAHFFTGPLSIDWAMTFLMIIYGAATFICAWVLRTTLNSRTARLAA